MSKANMIAGQYTAFAFEQITVSTTAVGFTVSNLLDSDGNAAKRVVIGIESAQIRWVYDGDTTPTSSVGMINNPFDSIVLVGITNIKNFRAIRAGSTDAQINVTFERS